MRLPRTESSVAVARKELTSWMRQQGGSREHIEDARLVISELVANSVRHASPLADGSILVSWAMEPEGVALSVTDGGSGSGPRRVETSPTAPTGRGMAIVDVLAREWWSEQSPSRATVHATLSL
jgi:anti-sigma regulatory factor (Ser/Thr protein kinase)